MAEWALDKQRIFLIQNKRDEKMKHIDLVLSTVLLSAFFSITLIAQSEQGYVLGIKNFEKSFPSDNSNWDSFDNLYAESGSYNNVIQDKLQVQETTSFNFTFNHLALSVKDVDRSADFYKKVLNLNEITNKTKIEGIRWLSLGEGKELHLISILKENVTINKALHFALTTSNFDDFIETLNDMNITYSDWPGTPHKINMRADGIKQIYFQDPDGYWVEVNSVAQK